MKRNGTSMSPMHRIMKAIRIKKSKRISRKDG